MEHQTSRRVQRAANLLLSISSVAENHAALERILDPALWQVVEADCCEAASRILISRPVAAIITDDALPDGTWVRMLGHVQAQSSPPSLIVASHLADERLWAKVLNLGGYDLILKPFETDEVRRVISLACPQHDSLRRPLVAAAA